MSRGRVAWGHLNYDKSPLIDLLSCIVCKETMKIEKSAPDAEGKDIIQYRCGRCDRIERVRLFRRSRDAAGGRRRGNDGNRPAGGVPRAFAVFVGHRQDIPASMLPQNPHCVGPRVELISEYQYNCSR